MRSEEEEPVTEIEIWASVGGPWQGWGLVCSQVGRDKELGSLNERGESWGKCEVQSHKR